MNKEKWSTVVIGAGQAGLATGYYLSQNKEDFVILDQGSQIGDAWRKRWDSLKLFTPAQHDGLPGFQFPASHGALPTKDEMADYLENYAAKFSIPVQLNTKVVKLSKAPKGYEINTSNGMLFADHVIVTTGTNPVPYIPDFAKDIDQKIIQIHSSQFKNPEALPSSSTLVVGAGTSGVEIALELSKSRTTIISGHPTPHIPDFIFQYVGKIYWWFAHNILTLNTPIGRKVRPKILSGGGPLINISFDEITTAGVQPINRLVGTKNGLPQLQSGETIDVSSIVWATGYQPDFSWINLDVTDETGWPKTRRGVVEQFKGLYFVGMLFQFGLTSGLVGGVGRDAAYVVNHLKKTK